MEKILYSSSELLFSNRSCWLKQPNGWIEYPNILAALDERKIKEEHNYYHNRKTFHDFISHNFWKYFSRRMWQKDDFRFNGIAAAFYIRGVNRYKIKFNPFKFYEFHINATLTEFMKEKDLKVFMEHVGVALEQDNDFTFPVKESGDSNKELSVPILKMLYKCHKAGCWDQLSWQQWNEFLLNNIDILRNVLSVFIHEYLHVILSHVSTRAGSRDPGMWNFATDFAINQSCIFTKEFRKLLITSDNKKFFEPFKVSAVVYQYKHEKAFSDTVDAKIKVDHENLYACIEANMENIKSLFHFGHIGELILNHLDGKSADEYYRIMQEGKPEDFGGGGASGPGPGKGGKIPGKGQPGPGEPGFGYGYDDHSSWQEDENGEGMEVDAMSEEEAKELKEKLKEFMESEKRSKQVTEDQYHPGFDALDGISKRTEARNALKDVLNKVGLDINDPNELMKGLHSIPGLNNFGEILTNFFRVKTKNWKQMLQNFMTSAINVTEADYTMSRESRIRIDYFPGKRIDRGLDVILAMDTSGSIAGKDWNDFCNQVVRISKDFNATQLRVIQCHTRIAFDQNVNISKITNMKLKETGGTMMQVIFEKLKGEKNRKPVILFTDGDIDHFHAREYPSFKTLIFLSRGHGHNKETLEGLGYKVISQDEE